MKKNAAKRANSKKPMRDLLDYLEDIGEPGLRMCAVETIRKTWQGTDCLWPCDVHRLAVAAIEDRYVEMEVKVKLRASIWQKLIAAHVDKMWDERTQIKPLTLPEGGSTAVLSEAVSRAVHRAVWNASERPAT